LANVKRFAASLLSQPSYTLMRMVARFEGVRKGAAALRATYHRNTLPAYLDDLENTMGSSVFGNIDRERFVERLEVDGVAFGLKLPPDVVGEINEWASQSVTYADRECENGFLLNDRDRAEAILKKPVLVAQYFNTTAECPAIARLAKDPVLLSIAANYLKSIPTFVGANLWWTFPVNALPSDRDKHAHVFHRDVDDFKFFKFFFYLTAVPNGEGAHVCVIGSHRNPPSKSLTAQWAIRRYADTEINNRYPADSILEICGDAGDGFAENTLCIHKGSTPQTEARLLLQLQFAMFDHGVMHDIRSPSDLAVM
jgi:hypothetical protein